MIDVALDGEPRAVASPQALRTALARFDAELPRYELWLSVPDGPSLCMLRSGPDAWLMHLRHPGDHGFTSEGDTARDGVAHYTLSNGQVDEYPLAWCIGLPRCHDAVVHFFASAGGRFDGVAWRES